MHTGWMNGIWNLTCIYSGPILKKRPDQRSDHLVIILIDCRCRRLWLSVWLWLLPLYRSTLYKTTSQVKLTSLGTDHNWVIPSEAFTEPCGQHLKFASWSNILPISIEIHKILPNWANRGRSVHGLPPNWNAWHRMTPFMIRGWRNWPMWLVKI